MNKRKSTLFAVAAIGALLWLFSFYAMLYFIELPIWGYIIVALFWFLLLLVFFEYKEKLHCEEEENENSGDA